MHLPITATTPAVHGGAVRPGEIMDEDNPPMALPNGYVCGYLPTPRASAMPPPHAAPRRTSGFHRDDADRFGTGRTALARQGWGWRTAMARQVGLADGAGPAGTLGTL